MKRKNLFVLAASVLLLVACGGTPASSSTSSTTEHETGLTTDPTPTSESTPAPTSESTPAPTSESTPTPSSDTSSSEQPVEYSVSITNKEELAADWYCVDGNRTVSFNFSPAGNRMELFESGLLKVESSNPDVVLAQNALLTPKAKGTAKITVTYGDATDTVDVEVLGVYDETQVTDIDKIELEKGADGKYIDATFTTAGVVTAPFKGGFFLDNGKAAIEVYVSGLDVAQGDYIIGGGTVTSYNTILEFKDFKIGAKLDKSLAPKTTLENPIEVGKEWGETETNFDGFKAISVWGTVTTFVSGGTDYDAIYPEDEGTYPVEPSYYEGTINKGDKVHWVGYGWNRTKYNYLGIYIDHTVEHDVESFTIAAKETLYKGGTAKMEIASYLPKIATKIKNTDFNWTVEPTTGATIDENGLLTGLAEGEVTVKAAAKVNAEVKAEAKVVVANRGGAVASINLSATELALKVGEEGALTGEVVSADPNNPSLLNEINWSSEDETIVSIDKDGKLKGLKAGTANVVATSLNVGADGNPVVAKCAVTVTYAKIAELRKGYGVEITGKVMGLGFRSFAIDDGTAGTYVYNYDGDKKEAIVANPAVGDVVKVKGEAIAQGGGIRVVPTSCEVVDAVVEPTVATDLTLENIDAIWAEAGNGGVNPRGLFNIKNLTVDSTGNYPIFSTEGTRKVEAVNYDAKTVPLTIGNKYNVKAYVVGNYNDMLTVNLISATEVVEPKLEVEIDKATIKVGETAQITATATNFDLAPTITYESADTSIATVSDAGVVTGVAVGNVEITVKAGDIEKKVAVTVVAADDKSVKVTFTAGTNNGTNGTSGNPDTMTLDGITVSGTSLATTTAEYRIYANSKLTISSTVGNIKRIVITSTANNGSQYGPDKLSAEGYTTSNGSKEGVWVGDAASVEFTAAAQCRASSILVVYEGEGGEEEGNPLLPVVATGNAGRQTQIDGAGAWIYLDNTDLGITGANAAEVVAASSVDLVVSYDGTDDAPKHYVTGGDAAVVMNNFEFNDYDDVNHTVRLFVLMDKGLDSSWGVKHAFTIKLVVGDKTYEGVVNFVGNALVDVTPIPEPLPDPIESTWAEAITADSATLDSGKFRKSSVFKFKFTAEKAGRAQLQFTLKCSSGHEGATFGEANYNNNGSVMNFTVANNGNAGTFLGEGKTYTQFGLSTTAKLLPFAEFDLVEGENLITITTDDGGFRLSPSTSGAMNLVYIA